MVGVGVITTQFVDAAAAQNAALGYDPAIVVVEHPIQDRTDGELRALAESAFEEVVAAVTASG